MDVFSSIFIDPFVDMVAAPDFFLQVLWEGLVRALGVSAGSPATSDADGRFRIDTGAEGGFWILVEADGYAGALSDRLPVGSSGFTDYSVDLVPVGGPLEAVAVIEAPDLARACAPSADRTAPSPSG